MATSALTTAPAAASDDIFWTPPLQPSIGDVFSLPALSAIELPPTPQQLAFKRAASPRTCVEGGVSVLQKEPSVRGFPPPSGHLSPRMSLH
jgi:hypothetical protein